MRSSSSIRAVFATAVLIITAQIVSAQAGDKKVPVDSLLHLQRGLPLERVEEIFRPG